MKEKEIVLVIEDGDIETLHERPFREGILGHSLEEGLQRLVEKFPNVVPGYQIDPASEDPPRFFLLCREVSVGNFFMDFLMIDQYAVLTILEIKLFYNPEARRAVIGQILEYAAYLKEFLGVNEIKQKASEFWGKRGENLEKLLEDFLGEADRDIDDFWTGVEENLQRNRIRLIILSDKIRPEVRRIIEFLNAETKNIEVLGLEIGCFGLEDDSKIVLVPKIIGQTQETASMKSLSRGIKKLWTYYELYNHYKEYSDLNGQRLLKILEFAKNHNILIESRRRLPIIGIKGRKGKRILSFFPDGHVYCFMKPENYSEGSVGRDALVEKLNRFSIFNYNPQGVVEGRMSEGVISSLSDEEFDLFLETLKDFV